MRQGPWNPRTAFAALPPDRLGPEKTWAGCEQFLKFNTVIESLEVPATYPFYGRC